MSNYNAKNLLDFAQEDTDAEARYSDFRSIDPFPHIEAALLNTADIADYISATGMICPFKPEKLKSASYEMDLGGQIFYCDDSGKATYIKNLCKDEEITLHKNSITYVTVNARFRVPDYIALRFNLQIEHVHRGLLLGTGPLINPGFNGNLMIPIHNLTENDYMIKGGESIIGVEFTKISKNQYWQNNDLRCFRIKNEGEYQPNLMKKNDKTFLDYLKSALPVGVGSVRSSLSSTLTDMKMQVADSQRTLQKIQNIASVIGAVSIFAVLALIFTTWSITSDANKYVADAEKNNYKLQNSVDDINSDLLLLHRDLNEANIRMTELNGTITALNNRINSKDEILSKVRFDVSLFDQNVNDIRERLNKIEAQLPKPK